MSFTENLRKIITKAKGTLKIQRFTGGEQRAALRAPLLLSGSSPIPSFKKEKQRLFYAVFYLAED